MTNEEALNKYIRRVLAGNLLKERRVYQTGVDAISALCPRWFNPDYITSSVVVLFEGFNGVTLEGINVAMQNALLKVNKHITQPELRLDVVDENEYLYDESQTDFNLVHPVIKVVYTQYQIRNIVDIRRANRVTVKNFLRNALWKIEHQTKGKDAQRYLAIIEEERKRAKSIS